MGKRKVEAEGRVKKKRRALAGNEDAEALTEEKVKPVENEGTEGRELKKETGRENDRQQHDEEQQEEADDDDDDDDDDGDDEGEERKGNGAAAEVEVDEDGEEDEEDEEDGEEDENEDEDEDYDDDDDEEEDSEEEDADGAEQEIVNVDFEFFDPKPVDFHGVKGLLKTYLDDTVWNLSELVDTIVAQRTVGTVVKTAEDEHPIGLISCLNLHRHQDKACVQEIAKYLRAKAGQKPEAEQLQALLAPGGRRRRVGLLVSERLLNLPFDLAGPLHTALFDEIAWATEDEPTAELRDSFKFDEYLLLTRVYEETSRKKDSSSQPRSKRKGEGSGGNAEAPGELVYAKPEDEVFHKLSSWSFTFPVNAEAQAARQVQGLRQLRLVMAMSAKKVASFRERLKRLIEHGV